MLIRVSREFILPGSGLALAAVSRRRFLGYSAGSVALLGLAACEGGAGGPLVDGGVGGKGDSVEFDENGVCLTGPTGTDALGPYWTPNLRQTHVLATPDEVGQRMAIFGRLLARDCLTPIPGAIVVAWQADDAGLYDYNHAGLNNGASQGVLTTDQTRLRGMFTTGSDGGYAVETIFPSEYPLNLLDPANSAYRAPHIHFAIFFTDASGIQRQLVTQMYFNPTELVRGKVPNIEQLNAGDFGASSAEPSRFITIDGSDGELWQGQFDIVFDIHPALVG